MLPFNWNPPATHLSFRLYGFIGRSNRIRNSCSKSTSCAPSGGTTEATDAQLVSVSGSPAGSLFALGLASPTAAAYFVTLACVAALELFAGACFDSCSRALVKAMPASTAANPHAAQRQ